MTCRSPLPPPAASTELLRRGLVVGEVGRGTDSSPGRSRQPVATLPHEPRGIKIDLEINYPMLPTQAAMIAKSLAGLERAEALDIAQRQGSSGGTQAIRNIATRSWRAPAGHPARSNLPSLPTDVSALPRCSPRWCLQGTLRRRGLTYPFIKGIAARLGITLVPLAMDAEGVRPDAVQKAHREAQLSALYIQPTIQNPLIAAVSVTYY